MKPGFGPVFQFRTLFSSPLAVDALWMVLKIPGETVWGPEP